jgi:cell division protein ZapA
LKNPGLPGRDSLIRVDQVSILIRPLHGFIYGGGEFMTQANREKTMKLAEVEIYGKKYKLRGENDEGYIREVAAFVDKKMREIGKKAKTIQLTELAVLTAVNITHEYFQSRREYKQRELFLDRKTKDLIESIEEEFEDMKF